MATRKPKGGGATDEDDLALWRHVTRDARPLPGRQPPAMPEALPSSEPPPAKPEPPAKQQRPPRKAPPALPARPRRVPDLEEGSMVGVDKRSVDRLRRGKLPVEARLDLHGMTQNEAEAALARFLAGAQAAGRRCVLVITGKGAAREREMFESPGVLKRMVPVWLNAPANRARVLAFATARPQHGGGGALYVLLKRQRQG